MSPETSEKRAIVLNIDGWRPDMLGPYGNTWIDTACLNQIAAESILWESCWTADPHPSTGLDSLLRGCHPLASATDSLAQQMMNDRLGTYITDQMVLDENRISGLFDRVIQIDSNVDSPSPAESLEQTATARFFAELMQWIDDEEVPDLLWIDYHGLAERWDAPLSMRHLFRADEDPEPPNLVVPPAGEFHLKSDDPDELLGYQQTYAAQIQLLDRCLDVLVDALRQGESWDSTLLVLTGQRAYPLGEHGAVGYYRPCLHKESLHVPLLVRWPGSGWSGYRSRRLIQPHQIWVALTAWCQDQPQWLFGGLEREIENSESSRGPQNRSWDADAIVSSTRCDDRLLLAIGTDAWKLVRSSGRRLYVRPDDLWEFNDVHDRCHEVVDKLDGVLDRAVPMLRQTGRLAQLALDDDLVRHLS